jgi:hypothetical protein
VGFYFLGKMIENCLLYVRSEPASEGLNNWEGGVALSSGSKQFESEEGGGGTWMPSCKPSLFLQSKYYVWDSELLTNSYFFFFHKIA